MKLTLSDLFALVLPLVYAVLLCACNSSGGTRAPGHSGPVPTAIAQNLIRELRGTKFSDATGVLGAGMWEVSGFAVVPNDVSPGGKGPVVRFDKGRDSRYVPVETNGDIADLYFRITNKTANDLTGPLSETYQSFWKKR